jgi:hypothetical protein
MQVFARRGFQLRSAPLETRVAYTGFLVLMLPAAASLLALAFGRTGFAPTAIAAYYRGGQSEMSFPKQFWQLMEVTHFHLFSVPMVLLVLSHLLSATPVGTRARVGLTVGTYAGAALEIAGPWAIRYVAGEFAYMLLAGWILLGAGVLGMTVLSLVCTWAPERWISPSSLAPAENGGGPGPR